MKVSIVTSPHLDSSRIIASSAFAGQIGAIKALDTFIAHSQRQWVGQVDGVDLCVIGAVSPSFLSNHAYLWLLTTKAAEEHKFILVRYSQIFIEEILHTWPTLYGHCVVDQTRSIRWLKWLGAVFAEPEGELIPFRIMKEQEDG